MAGDHAYLRELHRLWEGDFVAAILTARMNHHRIPPETAAVAQTMDSAFQADRDLNTAVNTAMGSLGLSGGAGASSGIDPDEYMFNAAMGLIATHRGDPPAAPALQARAAEIVTGKIDPLAAFELASPELAGTGLVSGALSLAGDMAPLLQRMGLFMAALAVPAVEVPELLSKGETGSGRSHLAGSAPAPGSPNTAYGSIQRTSTWAIASIVLAFVSWVGPTLLASIPAIITGHKARKEIHDAYGGIGGGGLALTGLVLGYANVVAVAVAAVILIVSI